MENEIENKVDLAFKVSTAIKKNKKLLLIILTTIIASIIIFSYSKYNENNKNQEISEKYIEAGILLTTKDLKNSKKMYKEIVLTNNTFYSLLSLNQIIENNLEDNNTEVLELFKTIENNNMEKSEKNLIKLKKSLYLQKISQYDESNRLLKEIISDNSIWKDAAKDLIK